MAPLAKKMGVAFMIAVVLDTNVVHRDPWLTNDLGQKLLQLAAKGICVVAYPQVVIEELYRQRVERAQRAHDSAAEGVADIAKAGVDVTQTNEALTSVQQSVGSKLDDAFSKVLEHPNVLRAPVPKVAAADLLKRDLERRRPFMEIEHRQRKKSVGFRDVLIWETVLELAKSSRYNMILFVTSDNGFIDQQSRTLHPDLLEDLSLLDKCAAPVKRVDSLNLANAELEGAAKREAEQNPEESVATPLEEALAIAVQQLRGPIPSELLLVEAATEALYALVNKEVSLQMSYGGGYDYPEFVRFSMPDIEGGVITDIDQISEFTFEESEYSPDIIVATADAIVSMEGAVHKSDWSGGQANGLGIIGDFNDHYFGANAEVEVQVVIELDIDGGIFANKVELRDLPQQLSVTDVQLDFQLVDELPPSDENEVE